MRTMATTSSGGGERQLRDDSDDDVLEWQWRDDGDGDHEWPLRDHGDDDRISSILFFFLFFPCGWYNLTARDNRLSHAVGSPAHENIGFRRPLGTAGRYLRTEK